MESISAADVKQWLDDNLGGSLFAKRRKAFSLNKSKSSVKKFPGKFKKTADF